MRACIQRVSEAKVIQLDEGNRISGQINKGFLVLLGVGQADGDEDSKYLARKIAGLRIFEDAQGKMNLNLEQVGGQVLVVSQFTLYADCVKGNRPSFISAASPEKAYELYKQFISELKTLNVSVEEGVFQTNMGVSLVNDGPVTIWLDSIDKPRKNKKQ